MILPDVRARLQAGGISWKVYESQIPSAGIPAGTPPVIPDDLIVLYEYPGSPPLHVKGVSAPVQRKPRFQVVCRSKSYTAARRQAEEVFGLLSGSGGVRALGEPFPLDRDADGRARIACNYEATRT